MLEASGNAAHLTEPGDEQDHAVPGSRRLPGPQARVTAPGRRHLERVGSAVGAIGSTLAIVGFALPIASGKSLGDGYGILLLLLLRGTWAITSHSGGELGWALLLVLL